MIDREAIWGIVIATLVLAIFVLILTGTVHVSTDPDCHSTNPYAC